MDGINFDNAELVCATPLIDKDVAKFFNVTKIIDGGRPGSILQIAPRPDLLAELMERTFQRLGPIGCTPPAIDEAISVSKQAVGLVGERLESLHLYVSDCHPWRDVTRSVLLKTKFVYKSRFPQMKLVSEYQLSLSPIKKHSKQNKKRKEKDEDIPKSSASPSPFQKSPWDFSLDEWSSAVIASNKARNNSNGESGVLSGAVPRDETPISSSFGAFSPGLTETACYSRVLQGLLLARRDQILGILLGSGDQSSSSTERYDNNTLKYVPFGQIIAIDICPLSNDIRGIIMTYHGDDDDSSLENGVLEKPSPLLVDPIEGERVIHRAYHFMMQIGVALNHMHSSGIVHLDIKPDNILVASDDCILKVGHCKQQRTEQESLSSSYHSKQVFKIIDFDCARFSASSPILVSSLNPGGDYLKQKQSSSPNKVTVNHSYISAGRRKFGSPGHTSPEYHVLNHGLFNAQAYDIFAFGSTAASLAINGQIFDSAHVQSDDLVWHQWLLINDFLGQSSIPSKFRLPTLKSVTGSPIIGGNGSTDKKKTIQSPAIHDDGTIVSMLPLWLHPALYCSRCIGKTVSLLCGIADGREAVAADNNANDDGDDEDSEEYDVDEREPYVDIIASQSSTLFGSGNKWSASTVQKQVAEYSKIQTSNIFHMKHIIRANSHFKQTAVVGVGVSRSGLSANPSSGCIGCYSCDGLVNEDGSVANGDVVNLPNRLFELHVLHNMLDESSNITSSSSSSSSDSFDSSDFIRCIDNCIMRDVEKNYDNINAFNPPDFIMHYIMCMIFQCSEDDSSSSESPLSSANFQWPSSLEFDDVTTIKSKLMYNEWWTLLCEFVTAYEMKVSSSTSTVSAASSGWMTGLDIQLSSPVHRFCYRIAINTLNLSKTVRHAMKSHVSERPSALDIMNNDVYKLISASCHLLINDNLDSTVDPSSSSSSSSSSKLREESSAITNFAPHVSKTYREIGAYGFYKRFSFDPSRMEQLFLPEEDKIAEMCPPKNPPLHQCASFMSDVSSQVSSIQSQVNSTPSLSSLNINVGTFIQACKSRCGAFKSHLISHFWDFIKNTPPRVCERIVGKGEATLLSMINENTVQPGLLYAMEMFRVVWSEEMEHMWLNYSATDEFAENILVCLKEYASSTMTDVNQSPHPSLDLEGMISGSFHLHSGMVFDFLIDMCMVFGACLVHATQIFAHDATESMNLIAFYAQQYMVRITTMEFARSGHPVASGGADRLYFVGRLDMLKMVNDDNYTAPSAIRDDESQSIQNEGIALMSSPAPSNLSLSAFWLDDPLEENSIPFVDIPGKALGRHASRTRRDLHAVGVKGSMSGAFVDALKLAKDVDEILLSGWQSVSASAEEGIINALPSSLADIISKSSSSSSSHHQHHDRADSSSHLKSQQYQKHERSTLSTYASEYHRKVKDAGSSKDYYGESDNADDKFSLVQLGSEKKREYIDSHRKLFCDDENDDEEDSYSVSSTSSFNSATSSSDDDSTRLWALPRSQRNNISEQQKSSESTPTHRLLISSGHVGTRTTSTIDNAQFKFTSRDSKQRRKSGYSTLPADSLTIDIIDDQEYQKQSKSRQDDRFFVPDAFDDDDDDQTSSHSEHSTDASEESASFDLLDVDSDGDDDDVDDIVVVLEKQRNAIASHFGSDYRLLSSRLECALMMRFSGHYPIPQLLLWYEGCVTQINASNIFITGVPLDLALVATFINRWMSISDFGSNNHWASLFMVICYKVHTLTSSHSQQSVASTSSPSHLNLKSYAPKNSSSAADILAAFKEWSRDVIRDMISSTLLADALVGRVQKTDDILSSILTAVGKISNQIVVTSTTPPPTIGSP